MLRRREKYNKQTPYFGTISGNELEPHFTAQAPIPALRQGIWAQADLLERLRGEVHALGGPLAEAKATLEVTKRTTSLLLLG